jgi:hypothetical protein
MGEMMEDEEVTSGGVKKQGDSCERVGAEYEVWSIPRL